MYGDVECDDLVSVFLIFIHNRESLADLSSSVSWLVSLPQTMTSYRFLNTLSNSRSNISAHYDISNDMFAGFLSDDMTYSCGIFKDLDGDLQPDGGIKRDDTVKWSTIAAAAAADVILKQRINRVYHPPPSSGSDARTCVDDADATDSEVTTTSPRGIDQDELYEAQMRKIRHIIRKANIRKGHRVLEIGSGWGALAIEAVRATGCEVDTLTLSVAQKELAEERIRNAGPEYEKRIRVHLMDYRSMPPEWEGSFDRFVSVEMIEAVGKEFLETYWRIVNWALKKHNATGVVQVITIPEASEYSRSRSIFFDHGAGFEKYTQEVDFIRKWVRLPRLSLSSTTADGSVPEPTKFLGTIEYVFILRP
jgi:cyclopropane-fatty-acyl-phospholipid synthase